MTNALRADVLEAARELLRRELEIRYPGREPGPDEYDATLSKILTECDDGYPGTLLMPEIRAALVSLRRQHESGG